MLQSGPLKHFQYLDGLRGTAALWVMIGHILTSYDIYVRLITWSSLAVDLFILVSGFLMVRQAVGREHIEPLSSLVTWKTFWLRRFFRIAPLYYFLLFCSVLLEQAVRGFDGGFVYMTWDGARVSYGEFIFNIIMHVTFLFGVSPEFSRSTWMPDWSISLEMQFYALFPFLMLLGRRFGWMMVAMGTAAACVLAGALFSTFLHEFTLPSIIVLKLNVFMGGMLIALALDERDKAVLYVTAAAALMLLPLWGAEGFKMDIDRALLCAAFGAVALSYGAGGKSAFSRLFSFISRTLGAKPFEVMADLSYGVYLIHFFIIYAWLRVTAPDAVLAHLGGPVSMLIVVPILAYALAWIARHTIELRGIAYGRRFIRRYRSRFVVSP